MTRWIALAIIGLIVAGGAGYAASRMATQPIGLSSEPITVGSGLAPKTTPRQRARPKARQTATPRPTSTATAAPTAAPTVGDHRGGGGGGRGGNHPEDD